MNESLKMIPYGIKSIPSMQVAKMVSKRHSDLLRDIEGYIVNLSKVLKPKNGLSDKINVSEYFIESFQEVKVGFGVRQDRYFEITEKGCQFVANKLTGLKGDRFTAKYIEAFHAMENALETIQETQEDALETNFNYTFKNQPVATVKQIADMYGCDGSTIRHYAKSNLKYGADYLVLSGKDLKCFKNENPRPELTMVGCLTVLFETAVEKIGKYLVTLGYKVTSELEKECDRIHKMILKAFSSDKSVSKVRSFDKEVVMQFLKVNTDQQIITLAKFCAQRDLMLYENFKLKSFIGDVSDKMSIFKDEAKQLEESYSFNQKGSFVTVDKYEF